MSDHAAGHDSHDAAVTHAGGGHGQSHAHPTAKTYLGIAVVLTIVTVIEVAVFYVPALHPFLVPILLTLSALKFAIVAMWYMHLKFDPRLYSWVFVVPMVFAAGIILALIVLLSRPRG
jgi:cytochrome c oxidase subunit 4